METAVVRGYFFILTLLACLLFHERVFGENYKLANGDILTGEMLPTSANDQGVQMKLGEGKYDRIPWAKFSQDDLKQFAKNSKLQPFVEPFIEVSVEEKIKKTEVPVKQPPRLPRPEVRGLFGAMFSSGLGIFILLVLYAANIYAGYEVALFRAQKVALVCGVSAALPVIGPIIFLCIQPRVAPVEQSWELPPAAEAPSAEAAAADAALNPMQGDPTAATGGLRLAAAPEAEAAAQPTTPAVVYQRGQFTFNRRFFETKFAGFFGMVKRDEDRDMVLLVKSARGEYVADRISRIAANDFHLQVRKGNATEEVMVPFQEIKEIQLKHKDS
jgi:hypothetical protein